jgi:hypothetical protein
LQRMAVCTSPFVFTFFPLPGEQHNTQINCCPDHDEDWTVLAENVPAKVTGTIGRSPSSGGHERRRG